MKNHPWDAEASAFQYPPLNAGGAGQPAVLVTGSLKACFQMVTGLDPFDRLNVEIETEDGEALFNGADIERMIAAGDYQ